MRALGGSRWVALAIAGALLGGPSAATAAGGEDLRYPLIREFTVAGSRGYEIRVASFGREVALSASSGRVGAIYSVKGKAVGNRIVARFGSLGRVAMTFRPAKPRGRLARGGRFGSCEDLRLASERGTFEGTIRFRGERGYTEVDARRGEGSALSFVGIDCRQRARPSALFPIAGLSTRLQAIAKRRGRTVSVDVLGRPGRGRVAVEAIVQERRGEMSILRGASVLVGGRNGFVTSGVGVHPAFAVLRPPKPFSGVATFLETGQGATSWTGSMAAWMPGAGKVSLAGPRFSSSLCRRPAEGPRCPAEPVVKRPFGGPAQDSGSQSQAPGAARLSWSR